MCTRTCTRVDVRDKNVAGAKVVGLVETLLSRLFVKGKDARERGFPERRAFDDEPRRVVRERSLFFTPPPLPARDAEKEAISWSVKDAREGEKEVDRRGEGCRNERNGGRGAVNACAGTYQERVSSLIHLFLFSFSFSLSLSRLLACLGNIARRA